MMFTVTENATIEDFVDGDTSVSNDIAAGNEG